MLDSIVSYVGALNPGWFYCSVFVSAFVENIFPPVPGDTVTVFAAYVVGRSSKGLIGVFVATNLGSIMGFMTFYVIGRMIPQTYFARKNYRFLPAASIETAQKWFCRYGYWLILFNRFLSGIRSVISIVCGLYRLPWPRVLLVSAIGCSIWNGLLLWAGYLLGANWKGIIHIMQHYNRILIIAVLVVAGTWLFRNKLIPRRDQR